MIQEQIQRDGNRLKNFESFILELVLLVYPLLLISGGIIISPHYLIIVLAILVGSGSYVFYSRESNSVVIKLLLSLLIAVPFYIIGLPGTAVILIFVYVIWRMYANFGQEQRTSWNFLAVNTVVFTGFYLFTLIYLSKPLVTERNDVNIILFLVTTVLFIVLRYVKTILVGRHSSTFKLREVNVIFVAILGVGSATYFAVYFFTLHIQLAIMDVYAYLFGGLFKRISPETIPTYSEFELSNPEETEIDVETPLPHPLNEEADLGIYVFIAVVIFAVILLTFILRRGHQEYMPTEIRTHKIRLFGRGQQPVASKPDYHYSMATNAVRKAYQDFEKDANANKYPRRAGETVKEWFARMDWGQSDNLFLTYDKVRYGALSITEEESRSFVQALEKIKKEMFEKDV